jgi:ribosomal protein S18 acetylase RimI-like enzyme
LRGYRSGDLEAMVWLDEACFSAAFRFDRRTMRQFAEARRAIVVIAEDSLVSLEDRRADGMAGFVGFIVVHLEGSARERYGYIVSIDVAPELRRAGLGGQLLKQAEEQVRASGVRRVGLHVAVDNAGAIRFYEGSGYARVGVAPGFYQEAGLDALIYLKELD